MLLSDDEVLKESLLFIPAGGARGRGRPRRRFYDTIKSDLLERGITMNAAKQPLFWEELSQIAANRTEWQSLVSGRR